MKTTHPFNTFKTLILTTAIGCATLGSLAAHAGNIIWTNSISGGWDTAANWNPNSVPGAGDTAIITNAGVAVSLNSGTTAGAVILGTSGGGTAFLSLNNQTLALNGPLTVNSGGAFTVDSGALVGNTNAVLSGTIGWSAGSLGGILTLAAGSTLYLISANNHNLPNLTLTNNGTVVWTTGPVQGGGGSGTYIYNNGVWNALDDSTWNNAYGYNGTVFNNYGTFRKSGGGDEFDTATYFANGVVFNQLAGVMDVQNGVNGLNLVLAGSGSFTGGYVTTNVAGFTYLSSGNFTINGTVTTTNVWEAGGNLVGANIINGGLNWQAGNWNNAVAVTIATNSTLMVAGGAGNNDLQNAVVTNNGTVVWASGTLEGGGGSGTAIYNNGRWLASSDQTFNDNFGYAGTVFNNYGTFSKTGGAGEFGNFTYFASGVVFNQLAGVLDVQSGVNGLNLVLAGSGSFTGGYITSKTGGLTYLYSGNFTINGTVTPTNLIENAGNLVGANVINGALTWQGGVWNGAASVTIATNSTLIVAGGAGNNDMGNTVVTNNGTVLWASGTIRGGGGNLNPGTTIVNNGSWNAQSDQTINNYFAYYGTVFNNYGTFSKTGGAGAFANATVFAGGVVFNQLAGVIDVKSGINGLSLVLQGNGNFTGGYIATNAAGLTYLSGGSFTINGTVTPTNVIENAGNLVGANVINGALTWQAGVWNGAASVTIATNSTLIVSGGAGVNDMANTVVTNNGTVLWASGTIRGGGGNLNPNPGTTIVNNGWWNAQSDQTINDNFGYNGTVFNNYGTFSKTGGAGEFDTATYFANGVVFNQLAGVMDVQNGMNGLNLVLAGSGSFTGGYVTTNVAGLTYLSSGSFTINGTATPTNLIENAGNLVGANVINGALTWQAGVWNGAASVTIAPNSTLIVAGGAGVNDMANTVVTNNGTVLWASGTIRGGGDSLNPGTTINNYGLWESPNDQTINDYYGYNNTVFNNYGTFSKTGGASANQTLFTAGVLFNQLAGVLDVQSGGNGLNLVLQGNGNFTGGYVTSKTGGLTYLSSGNFTLNGAVTSTNLIENAGNLAGSNVIHGALTWQAGVWNGAASVTIATNSTLILAGGGFGYNDMANTVVINNGTVLWTSGTIRGGGGNHSPGTLIVNNGLWLVPSSMVINNYYGYNNTIFDNFGTFRKIGISNGVTEIDVEFDTGGLLDVQTGIVWFHGPVTYQGIVNFGISSGATYGQIWDDNPVAIQGALSVNLINGYASLAGYGLGTNNVNGDIPALITWPADSTYYTITGFGNPPLTNMPAGETWSARYSNTGIYLLLASINPQLTGVNLVGTNLVLSGAGGSAGSNYVVLASTNLTLPLANWTMLTTNAFDVNGLFNFTNPVNSGKPKEFFTFKVP